MDRVKQAAHSIFAHSRRASRLSARLRQPASPSLAALGLPKPLLKAPASGQILYTACCWLIAPKIIKENGIDRGGKKCAM